MTVSGYDFNRQCDWADYFPPNPTLESVARDSDFRATGMGCLAPDLGAFYGVRDVRGYDANDPYRMVRLLDLFRDPSSQQYTFARTLGWVPANSPLAHLVGIKYLIFRGEPPKDPSIQFVSPDYWVRINPLALPRVSVPAHVFVFDEKDEDKRLKALSDPRFDPRIHAIVESGTPTGLENRSCAGKVRIVSDTVQRIEVEYDMQTPGMLLMTDRFDPGWKALVDGKEQPILAADEAFRGVILPAGKGRVEFIYAAPAFWKGMELAGAAFLVWALWGGCVAVWRTRRYHGAVRAGGSR
jgi:hypothetical protein